MSFLYSIRKSMFGGHNSRILQKEAIEKVNNPTLSYNTLLSIVKDQQYVQSTEAPIFIFSAGWRSGSTLLQRLITSKNDILLWGEPFDRCNLIQNMANSLIAFDSSWPPQGYFIKNSSQNLAEQWIANLYPSLNTFLASQTNFLLEMFSKPAEKIGALNWGIKEVRFGLKEALLLKLLFPNAKFLFIERDLYDAFSSYKSFNPEMPWFAHYPSKTVFTPYKFATHRRKMIKEMTQAQKVVGGIYVKYEELVSNGNIISSIEDYCEISIDKNLLRKKIGSGNNISPISVIDKILLGLAD